MSRRGFYGTALLLALLIAGFGSYYASAHPDGLEHVAQKTGFSHSADDAKTADSPFADYQTKGVDDERLGGGIAGVAGVVVVLVVMSGLVFAIRRRRTSETPH